MLRGPGFLVAAANVVLLVVALGALAPLSAASADKLRPFEPQCYTVARNEIQPCLMMADADGVFGCGQCDQHTLDTSLAPIDNTAQLREFLKADNFNGQKLAILLPAAIINDPDLAGEIISQPNNVAFILVQAPAGDNDRPAQFSGDRTNPNDDQPLVNWNPVGTGLAFKHFPFQVFLVNRRLANHIRGSTLRFPAGYDPLTEGSPKYTLQSVGKMFSCGEASDDNPLTSLECLAEGKCTPVGGQSIWSAVGRLQPAGVPLIGVAAPLDSDAFFRYNSSGSASEVASVAVMMAVAEAFGKFRAQTQKPMQVRPVFFGFHAESMEFAGSDRFFHQVDNFTCTNFTNITTIPGFETIDKLDRLDGQNETALRFFPGCDDPYIPSLRFKQFQGAEWNAFIDLTQIGTVKKDASFYLHTPRTAATTESELETSLLQSFGDLISTSTASALPPTLLRSVGNNLGTIPAALVTGFDAQFTNPFFHSLYDSPEYLTSLNNMELLCQAATSITATLIRLAYPDTSLELSRNVPINCTYIQEFVGCLSSPGYECTVDDEIFGQQKVDFDNRVDAYSQFPSGFKTIGSLESGPQSGQSVKWDLIASFLGLQNAIEVTDTPCKSSDDCSGITLENNDLPTATASTFVVARCISDVCVLSDTFLHEAYGSGLQQPKVVNADGKKVDGRYELQPGRQEKGTITESIWDRDLGLCAKTENSRQHDVIVFVVGILVWLVAGLLGYFTQYAMSKIDQSASSTAV